MDNDLISRSALLDKAVPKEKTSDLICQIVTVKDIKAAPAVDAVEVVRCEKCVYRQAAKEYGDLMCGMLKVPMKSNDFCSYGEKEYGANAWY